jgi:hypothetical protein
VPPRDAEAASLPLPHHKRPERSWGQNRWPWCTCGAGLVQGHGGAAGDGQGQPHVPAQPALLEVAQERAAGPAAARDQGGRCGTAAAAAAAAARGGGRGWRRAAGLLPGLLLGT